MNMRITFLPALAPSLFLAFCTAALAAEAGQAGAPSGEAPSALIEKVRSSVKNGELAYRLSTPDDLKTVLGEPEKERHEKDGNSTVLILEYPNVKAVFVPFTETAPPALFQIDVEGTPLDIGRGKQVTLRNLADLAKLDTFWGAAGVSLERLDLREQMPRLGELPFDTLTRWPAAERLPKDFDPAGLLEAGKNPGLGLRKLHEQGIDGRGIHIAIIDQPLLRTHRDYQERVVEYTEIDLAHAELEMHGPAVTSIAVGKTCGVAPGASVHYYAVPTWKWWNEHCKPYAATLDRIIAHNQELPAGEKVRVVSISLGAFSAWPDAELWTKAVQRASAAGVLVVTCDRDYFKEVMLKRIPGQDPDSPTNYTSRFLVAVPGGLGVPAGNRTTAARTGPNDYVFWREGGMSWTVPYLAGLAALALQVDGEIKPQAMCDLWMKTASQTAAGRVVNPPAFIDAVRAGKASRE